MRLDKKDHRSLVLWATECAEHVLPYFEENYPNDNRPRNALEAGRACVRGEIATSARRAPPHPLPTPQPAPPVTQPQQPTLPLTPRTLPTTL